MNAHPGPIAPPAVKTTCPYCGVGCGIVARPDGLGGISVEGDPDHPANFGRLCSKGSALGETVGLDGRLLRPVVRGRRASWDEALDEVASSFSRIAATHGPEAIGFYLSGQLLTEDYYVANKLMKGFIGSGNVDTNSRLCMSSSVAGHRRAFGADIVPGCYEDLDQADLIVLVGSNAAWCHPILFRRMVDNRAGRGAKIVVIDPRRSATGEEADLFLPVAAGQDTVLFSGLLVHLADRGVMAWTYLDGRVDGFDAALDRARVLAPDLPSVAKATGLPPADIMAFYELFRTTEKTVTCYSQGVNQSAQGTDKVGAILNCHLATGRVGRPGMGPFSLTGQPNAMGGREVGGLANMLAAHMNYVPAEIDRVGRFWGAASMAEREGLKAVSLFDAIDRGEIKALWVMATNPAVSMPDADRVRNALGKLDLLVVSENVRSNDTISRGAHVLLPAAAWGEKDGTVTNSERRISRQRAVLPLPGEAKPDWWIVSQVAGRMGFGRAFPYRSAADIFREHAALTAFENDGSRVLDLGGLAGLSDAAYEGLQPIQWPVQAEGEGTARLFADRLFQTPDGRARMIVPEIPALATPLTEAYPFRLNTGRIRDQWHTMTRSGLAAKLGSHRPMPFVEMNPADAAALGLQAGDLARLTSAEGSVILDVRLEAGQEPGTLFAPIHWSQETSSDGRIGALVPGHVDPVSGQPELKATPVRIEPVDLPLRGFVLSRGTVALPDGTWWARAAVDGGQGLLFASGDETGRFGALAPILFPGANFAEYLDGPGGSYRCAAFQNDRLEGVLFVGPAAARPHWEAARGLFAAEAGARDARAALSGRAAGPDAGPLVCACFGVGLATIRSAIRERGATSTEAIGAALRAGTNCGSCLPELRLILVGEAAAA